MNTSRGVRLLPVLIPYRNIWIGSTWLVSLVVTVLVLALADFGAPSWISILCGIWLCSFDLPTTFSLLALAGVWGRIPGMETPPLSAFAVSVASFRSLLRRFPSMQPFGS